MVCVTSCSRPSWESNITSTDVILSSDLTNDTCIFCHSGNLLSICVHRVNKFQLHFNSTFSDIWLWLARYMAIFNTWQKIHKLLDNNAGYVTYLILRTEGGTLEKLYTMSMNQKHKVNIT